MRPTHAARRLPSLRVLAVAVLAGLAAGPLRAADAPSPKLAMSFQPVHRDADIETPEAADIDKCRVQVERTKSTSGWVVYGPQGQMLRRFIDTDGDNVVDQWRYYKHGLEVYRDIDTNADNKVDQTRYLNTGGSRWGLDDNQDGVIDRWKTLSAQEASLELVRAIRSGKDAMLAPLFVSAADAKSLQLTDAATKEVLTSVAEPGRKLREVMAKSKTISTKSVWIRFDAASPSVIPADAGKADADLWVYENAMAIVETDGEPGLMQLGEMVRVGEVWKFTQIPAPLEGETIQVAAGGVLMVPSVGGGVDPVPMLSESVRELLEELRELDENAPAIEGGRDALVRYNTKRAELLEELVKASETASEREQFWKQMVDGLAAAVQTGAYPDGFEKLKSLESQLVRAQPKSPLVPYVTYRRMNAEYSSRMQAAGAAQRGEVQEWWLGQLEEFGKAHPDAEDSADALFQLANAQEFAGEFDEAKKWYRVVASKFGSTPTGERAAGALKRIDSVGQPFALRGTDLRGNQLDVARLRGKVVLVVYWATWSQPFVQELPQLQVLLEDHQSKGFEIVGVNLDVVPGQIKPFLDRHRVDWPQIYEEGGLESPPAKQYGVIAVPTMFLVGRDGKVVSRSAALEELKEALPKLLEQ